MPGDLLAVIGSDGQGDHTRIVLPTPDRDDEAQSIPIWTELGRAYGNLIFLFCLGLPLS